MIRRGSPGTLYVNCICIARRRICSVIRVLVRGYGEWRRHFSRRAVAVNAHPGFGEQAGGEHG